MPKKIADKVVFHSKWMAINEATIEAADGSTSPYYYLRYPWSNSTGVAILCYRDKISDDTIGDLVEREILGRFEYLPAHGEEMHLSSITGGYDKSEETYAQCAIRELEEEGGFTTSPHLLQHLGEVRTSKSSDNIMHLFAVNINNCTAVEAVGDGTVGEEGSYTKWVSEQDALWSEDVLLSTMIARLNLGNR